jgi:hypothetical protein
MATNLKLEVFRISLKKKNASKLALYNFKELFDCIDKDKKKAYEGFVQGFINYFNNEFKMNRDENKGISASSDNQYQMAFESNVINGEVYGGPTDMEQTIYKRKDAKKKTGNLSHDDIVTVPFFFKVWTPYDHNTGVLMVQSYSNETITVLVKQHLTKYIQDFGYSLIITPHISKAMAEKYEEQSNVYKVTYVKETISKDKRKLLNPLFTDFDHLKIKIEVTGFKKSVKDFKSKFFNGENKTLGSNLEDFDIREQDDYEVIAHYKDEQGHESHTSHAKNLISNPTIFLPETLKQKDKHYYDFAKIVTHSNGILNDIKKEINYDPK